MKAAVLTAHGEPPTYAGLQSLALVAEFNELQRAIGLLSAAKEEADRDQAVKTVAAVARRSEDVLLTRFDAAALVPVLQGRQYLLVHVERASDILQVLELKRDFPSLRIVLVGASEGWTVADRIATGVWLRRLIRGAIVRLPAPAGCGPRPTICSSTCRPSSISRRAISTPPWTKPGGRAIADAGSTRWRWGGRCASRRPARRVWCGVAAPPEECGASSRWMKLAASAWSFSRTPPPTSTSWASISCAPCREASLTHPVAARPEDDRESAQRVRRRVPCIANTTSDPVNRRTKANSA